MEAGLWELVTGEWECPIEIVLNIEDIEDIEDKEENRAKTERAERRLEAIRHFHIKEESVIGRIGLRCVGYIQEEIFRVREESGRRWKPRELWDYLKDRYGASIA